MGKFEIFNKNIILILFPFLMSLALIASSQAISDLPLYPTYATDPNLDLIVFVSAAIFGGMLWIPAVIIFSTVENTFLIPILILILILFYLRMKNKLKLIYILPLLLGLVGGIISYFLAKDKKLRLKLLLIGVFISLVMAALIFYLFFYIYTPL